MALGLVTFELVRGIRYLARSFKHIEPERKRITLGLTMMISIGLTYGGIFLWGGSWLWRFALDAWLPKQQCVLREPLVSATYQHLEGQANQLTNISIWLGLIGVGCLIFCAWIVHRLGCVGTHERVRTHAVDVTQEPYFSQPYGQLSGPSPHMGAYQHLSQYPSQPPAQYPPQ